MQTTKTTALFTKLDEAGLLYRSSIRKSYSFICKLGKHCFSRTTHNDKICKTNGNKTYNKREIINKDMVAKLLKDYQIIY